MIVRVELHLSPEAKLNGNSFVFLRLEYQQNSCLFSREWKGFVPFPLPLRMADQMPLTLGSVWRVLLLPPEKVPSAKSDVHKSVASICARGLCCLDGMYVLDDGCLQSKAFFFWDEKQRCMGPAKQFPCNAGKGKGHSCGVRCWDTVQTA